MKLAGFTEPPLTSFRLRNMWADTTGIPLDATRLLTGPLPYTMEQGVRETIAWLRGETARDSRQPQRRAA